MSSPIRLVAVDLDGTLLNDSKDVSERTIRAFAGLPERGVKVVIASARPPRSVRPIYQKLNLATWQINYNGALIWDEGEKQVVHHQPMSGALVREIVDTARDFYDDLLVSCEILDRWYTDRPDNSYTNDLSEVKEKNCKLIDNANVSILSSPMVAPKAAGSGGRSEDQKAGSNVNQAARVAPSTQKERDAEARRILEQELQQQQARLEQQLKAYNNGQPDYLPSERLVGGGVKGGEYAQRVATMKDQIAMTQANIAALQRELQKYPQ